MRLFGRKLRCASFAPHSLCVMFKNSDTPMNPQDELENGVNLLKPVMEASGFHYVLENVGNSSGGNFSQGAFISGAKRLELSFRWSLGCVEYQIKGIAIGHEEYMEAVEKKGEAKYPGFSNKPIEAFEHLASDISKYCGVFLKGSNEEFIELIDRYRLKSKRSGFAALSSK